VLLAGAAGPCDIPFFACTSDSLWSVSGGVLRKTPWLGVSDGGVEDSRPSCAHHYKLPANLSGTFPSRRRRSFSKFVTGERSTKRILKQGSGEPDPSLLRNLSCEAIKVAMLSALFVRMSCLAPFAAPWIRNARSRRMNDRSICTG
jgi:hypothetical protein